MGSLAPAAAQTFGPQQVITTAANGAHFVDVADLDGDGDADALSRTPRAIDAAGPRPTPGPSPRKLGPAARQTLASALHDRRPPRATRRPRARLEMGGRAGR